VGSSDGGLVKQIHTLLHEKDLHFELVASEPDSLAFEVLRNNLQSTKIVTQNIPFEVIIKGDELYDCVICTHVFYHFEDIESVLLGCLEILHPKGRLIIILDTPYSPIYISAP
jgi:2-polyprenyl-3-methyl-5-hydroxy-6-metoxy-1,4-benzoquinol methylase